MRKSEVKSEPLQYSEDNIKNLVKKVRDVGGRITSTKKREEIEKEMEKLGITKEGADTFFAIVAENATTAFLRLIRNIADTQLRKSVNSYQKMLSEDEEEGGRKSVIRLLNKRGLKKDCLTITSFPWLNMIDCIDYVSKRGHHLVAGQIFTYSNRLKFEAGSSETATIIDGEKSIAVNIHPIWEFEIDINSEKVKSWLVIADRGFFIYTNHNNSTEYVNALNDDYNKISFYKNRYVEITAAKSTIIVKFPSLDVKDCIMSDSAKSVINRISGIVDRWDLLPKGRRKTGVLLYGKPGTGKTSIITNMIKNNEGKATIVSIKGGGADFLASVMYWARKIGPNIVIFEDIDGIQVNREATDNSFATPISMSVLLNTIDGTNDADNIVIATTNHPEKIDKAILRPGRIGMSIDMDDISDEMRERIIKHYYDKYELNGKIDWDVVFEGLNRPEIYGVYVHKILESVANDIMFGEDACVSFKNAIKHFFEDNYCTKKSNDRGPMIFS